MIDLGKKGDLKRILMILVVMGLLFGAFVAVLGSAETAEEEKARLEAELGQLETQLAAIEGGKWVNISDGYCNVKNIFYNNWNCDNPKEYREYLVNRINNIKDRLRELEKEQNNEPSNNNTNIIWLLASKIKRKKRAQQSQANLLNSSSSRLLDVISIKLRYIFKFFGFFIILAYNSLKSYHQTSALSFYEVGL